MSNPSRFFLKCGYIENTATSSLDTDERSPHDFWTQERLSTSAFYQHHVYKYAAQLAKQKQLRIISDVGCGPAVKTSKFFPDNAYKVTLYDQESCRHICESQMPSANFISINLDDISINQKLRKSDLVICSDVLEHLLNPSHCIQLCKQIVSAGGYIIFSTPERDNLRGIDCMKSAHPQHVREWNREEFLRLLIHSGLTIKKSLLLPQHALKSAESVRCALTRGFHNPKKYRSCHLALCSLS